MGRVSRLCCLIVLVSDFASAQSYADRARGKGLSEGVGIEGIITVYDETPRMWLSLGPPRTEAQYPLWYFYDDGPFKLTLRAQLENRKFKVRSIKYSGDRAKVPALKTRAGITLRDTGARVLEVYGQPESVSGTEYRYPARGVSFHLSAKAGHVTAITVFRSNGEPVKRVDVPATLPLSPKVVPVKTTPVKDVPVGGPASFGLLTGLTWRVVGKLEAHSGTFRTSSGALEMHVSSCGDCQPLDKAWKTLREKFYSVGGPPVRAALSSSELARIGARRGYAAQFLESAKVASGRIWVYLLVRKVGQVEVSIRLVPKRPTQPQLAELVRLLRELRLGDRGSD